MRSDTFDPEAAIPGEEKTFDAPQGTGKVIEILRRTIS
jgi:hypothetical protein